MRLVVDAAGTQFAEEHPTSRLIFSVKPKHSIRVENFGVRELWGQSSTLTPTVGAAKSLAGISLFYSVSSPDAAGRPVGYC